MRSKKPIRQGLAYDALDSVIHERARLSVLTCLVTHPKGLGFADLKTMCALTDGNLSRHLQVLQEAGLVEVIKGYEGNRPHTTCRLTKSGRKRFVDYLGVLEQLVRDAAKAAGKEAKKDAKQDSKQDAPISRVRILPA